MAELQGANKKHHITIEGRQRIHATGILSVDFFSDELITAQTDLGQLNIKGEGLHIETISKESGEVWITGKPSALSYAEQRGPQSFWDKLFK